ncbi:hypothetical protein LZ30DRAFT_712363 [Colletotrichum cereale]|nr:hypothetical protein LZ30DRAFT_712363 [Colletotrichum cereale]
MPPSRIPSSREPSSSSSGESSSKHRIFVYGPWRQPSVLYSIILDNMRPRPEITERFTYIQATLCDDPRQPPYSGRRGASMDGVYIIGLTEAEIERMDNFLAGTGCTRHEVVVQFICRHGRHRTGKAFVWFPSSQPIDGMPSWNAGPSSRPGGGSNGAARALNPGAAQALGNSTFGGAAYAA